MRLFALFFVLASFSSVLVADPTTNPTWSPGNDDKRVDDERWRRARQRNLEMFIAYLRDTETGFPQLQHHHHDGDRNKRGSPKRRRPQNHHGRVEREAAREIFSRFPKASFRKLRRMYMRRREKLEEKGGITRRRTRLWCRGGIGYHMEVTGGGAVVARHRPTDEGSLLSNFVNYFVLNIFLKFSKFIY